MELKKQLFDTENDQNYHYDNDEYPEGQQSDYEVNKEEYDTSVDYGYLNDLSNLYDYL
jgi:hypothetical protein